MNSLQERCCLLEGSFSGLKIKHCRSVTIFDASVAVVDNDKITKETPHERCKRNLAMFCHVSNIWKSQAIRHKGLMKNRLPIFEIFKEFVYRHRTLTGKGIKSINYLDTPHKQIKIYTWCPKKRNMFDIL